MASVPSGGAAAGGAAPAAAAEGKLEFIIVFQTNLRDSYSMIVHLLLLNLQEGILFTFCVF